MQLSTLSPLNRGLSEHLLDRLIAEIAAVERAEGTDAAHSLLPGYYEHWLASFERLLVEKGILTKEEMDTRKAELKSGQV